MEDLCYFFLASVDLDQVYHNLVKCCVAAGREPFLV